MRKLFSKISLIVLLAASLTPATVEASGVTVTLYPSSSSTSPTTVGATWTRTSATTYATGTTITLTITPAITSVSSTSAIDLDNNGADDTTFTSSSTDSSVTIITYTVATTTLSQTTFTVTSTLSFTATPKNYSISVFTSSPVDFGAALFYANGGNQVNVTANVQAALSFAVRNSGDTADTNACALGTLTAAAVSTCSYRLRIATNAANGFQTTIQADHDLASGYATMTAIGDNAAFVAGTERYGIQTLTGATVGGRSGSSVYDQPVVENSGPAGFTFNTDSSPVPTSTAPVIISYGNAFNPGAAPSTTSTSLVTHAAAIDAGTPAGNYSQTVTYSVTATF